MKKIHYSTIKDIRNLSRPKQENETINNRIIRDIRNLFQHEEEYYYKPARVGSFSRNHYFEYESNGDRNKTL